MPIVVEWFSGIGGMRFAYEMLYQRDLSMHQFISFDINEIANSVYSYSFNGDQPRTKTIDALSLDEIESLNADIWLLSPPCQPFTRGGSRLDANDNRSRPILHLINILRIMKNPPSFIFLENVPGFERSTIHAYLLNSILSRNYYFEEYLISPTDPSIKVPNARLRYYMAAKSSAFPSISSNVTSYDTTSLQSYSFPIVQSLSMLGYASDQFYDGKKLQDYLDTTFSSDLLVPKSIIQREKGFRFDLISVDGVPLGHRASLDEIPACSTFTKGYGSNKLRGTGSLLLTSSSGHALDISDNDALVNCQLRYFSPLEIARLHCFPLEGSGSCHVLQFPPSVTLIQKFRLLGNSLNIRVVSILLARLFLEYPCL